LRRGRHRTGTRARPVAEGRRKEKEGERIGEKEEKKKAKHEIFSCSHVAPAFSVLLRIEFPAPKVPKKRREVYLSNGLNEI
jgi:hypothetical protein